MFKFDLDEHRNLVIRGLNIDVCIALDTTDIYNLNKELLDYLEDEGLVAKDK